MTSLTSKHIVALSIVVVIIFCIMPLSIAAPMDGRMAEMIPEILSVMKSVHKTGVLTNNDNVLLLKFINTEDPVLISLVAYTVGESRNDDGIVLKKLSELPIHNEELYDLQGAFITLALLDRKTIGKSDDTKLKELKNLVNTNNSILRIEAAKRILKLDEKQGKTILEGLESKDDPSLKYEAEIILKEMDQQKQSYRTILPDELYEMFLSVIEEINKDPNQNDTVLPQNSSGELKPPRAGGGLP
jgi:hypothetical protein